VAAPTVVRSTPQPAPAAPAHTAVQRHAKTPAKTGPATATTVTPIDAVLPSITAPSTTAPAGTEPQQGYDSTRLPEQPPNTAAGAPQTMMASQPASEDAPPPAAPAAEEQPAPPADGPQDGALPAVAAQPAASTPPASSSSPSDTTPAGPAAP
jgi:hypothetical protein